MKTFTHPYLCLPIMSSGSLQLTVNLSMADKTCIDKVVWQVLVGFEIKNLLQKMAKIDKHDKPLNILQRSPMRFCRDFKLTFLNN